MFDFAWSELALIGVVALVAIGPKDMPVAIKSVAKLVKKARRMAGEFQTHVDDLMKEADLSEVRTHFNELRSFNLRDQMTRAVDPDGALRNTLADKPFLQQADGGAVPAGQVDDFVGARPEHVIHDPHSMAGGMSGAGEFVGAPYAVPPPDHLRPDLDRAPAFIPPEAVAAERALREAPAFIPPEDAVRGIDGAGEVTAPADQPLHDAA